MTNNVVSQDEIIWQNEVLEMAKQAGMRLDKHNGGFVDAFEIKRFAKLVALRYEKKIADLENIICQRHWDVLQEREACAKLCEAEWTRFGYDADARDCAEEIRTRGETTLRGEA